MSQWAFQFLSTSLPAGPIPDASPYPVIMHLTKVIDISFLSPLQRFQPIILICLPCKGSPGLDSCQISECTNTCISQKHTYTHTDVIGTKSVIHWILNISFLDFMSPQKSSSSASFFLSSLSPSLFPSLPLLLYFLSAFPRNFFLVSHHRISYSSVSKELERIFNSHLYFWEIHVPEREPCTIHGFPLPSGKLSSTTVPTQYAWLGPCPLHQLPLHLSHHNVTTQAFRPCLRAFAQAFHSSWTVLHL